MNQSIIISHNLLSLFHEMGLAGIPHPLLYPRVEAGMLTGFSWSGVTSVYCDVVNANTISLEAFNSMAEAVPRATYDISGWECREIVVRILKRLLVGNGV